MIAIWKGSVSTIPTGWVLCDGSNDTPDLRDKFVLGAGNSYSVDNTGGEETHTLTIDEMPSHSHTSDKSNVEIPLSGRSGGTSTIMASMGQSYMTDYLTVNTSISIKDTGGGQAHNNMPPYYALCYIMKT